MATFQQTINPTVEKIKERLKQAFSPEILEVIDESSKHHGHVGAESGGHFAVRIKATAFLKKPLIQSHQMVYQALGEMMQHDIHALKIKVL